MTFDPTEKIVLAAQGYSELGMHDDALAELDSIPKKSRALPAVLETRVIVLMHAKRWAAALAASQKLCRVDPDYPNAFIHAAFCLHELGRTADARDTLLNGPTTLHKLPTFHYNLACYECRLGQLDLARAHLQRRVASFWPAFARNGKADVTIAQLVSHQAGLAALSRSVPVHDHEQVAAALAEETPNWEPGSRHGYHPRTFGFLLDEVVRRITGLPLATYWRQTFAAPLQLDLWIGIDPELTDSVAPVFPARNAPPKNDPFYTAFLTSGSLTARAFSSPRGLHSAAHLNTTEARTASYPGFGGIGTASSLARFYAMLAQDGSFQGRSFFRQSTLELMRNPQVSGNDSVLLIPTAFSAGFMQDPAGSGCKLRRTFGPSLRAFGHPGAGGSLGFADPDSGLGFAYVMNQMAPGVLPNPRCTRLVDALYGIEPGGVS